MNFIVKKINTQRVLSNLVLTFVNYFVIILIEKDRQSIDG